VPHTDAHLARARLLQFDVVVQNEGLSRLFQDGCAHRILLGCRDRVRQAGFARTRGARARRSEATLDGLVIRAALAFLSALFLAPALAARAEERMIPDRTVLVAVDRAYPPHQFANESGDPAGFDVDLFRAVAAAVGLRYDMRVSGWPEIRAALETGDVDVNPGVFYTAARAGFFQFSAPTVQVRHTVFVRSSSPIREPRDVLGRSVLINRSGLHDDRIRERDLPVDALLTSDSREAIVRLAAGEGDAAVVLDTQGIYFLRSAGISNVHSLGKPLDDEALRFAVPLGNDDLLAALNDGLARVRADGTYDSIYDRWFGVMRPAGVRPEVALRGAGIAAGALVGIVLAAWLWTRALRRRVARASHQLVESDARLRATLTAAPGVAFLVTEGAGDEAVIVDASASAGRLVGLAREELVGRPVGVLRSPADFQRHATLAPAPDDERRGRQAELMRGGGSPVPVFLLATALPGEPGAAEGSVSVARELLVLVDLTERVRGEEQRRELERRLLESEKLEALGRLAGSVAHDFNNLLMVVQGSLEQLRSDGTLGGATAERLLAVDVACDTAAQLVRQLQTFGGSTAGQTRQLTWNDVVHEIEALLHGSVPATTRLELRLAPGAWTLEIDPVEARQVVLNLVLNARDAIEGPGVIEVATSNRVQGGIPVAVLDVRDDGRGMSEGELAHGFEPFFTTRGEKGGTGLGLATVHAVVCRAGGSAEIDSAPGRGTRVRVALPRFTGPRPLGSADGDVRDDDGSAETLPV
jgi:signal transduction histidine kinase